MQAYLSMAMIVSIENTPESYIAETGKLMKARRLVASQADRWRNLGRQGLRLHLVRAARRRPIYCRERGVTLTWPAKPSAR